MPKRLLVLIAAGLALGAGIGLLGLTFFPLGPGRFESNPENTLAGLPEKGAPAPDFELQNTHGEVIRLSDLRGKVVLINFWATWCAPCRVEMPAIQSRYERHAPELEVLAVDFDEPLEDVQAFANEFELTFHLLLDPGGQVNQQVYKVRGYPSSYFVDPNGVIQVIHIGLMTEGQLDDYLAELGLTE